MFDTDLYLEENLARVWDTEPMTPSIGGVAYDFDAVGSDDGTL